MAENLWRTLFWAAWLFVSYNAFAPPDRVTAPHVSDIVLHACAFVALTGLLLAAYRQLRLWPAVLLLLGYGGAIELVQAQLPERSAEWADFGIDAIGIGVGVVAYVSFGERWLLRINRWIG